MTDIQPPPDLNKNSILQDSGKRRMALLAGALGFGAIVFIALGGDEEAARPSNVAGPNFPQVVPTDSQELTRSPTFLKNIQEETEDRANRAAQSGETSVAPFLTPEVTDVREEPVQVAAVVQPEEDDPFANLIADEEEEEVSPRNSRRTTRRRTSAPKLDNARVQAASTLMGEIIRLDTPRPSVGLAFQLPEDPIVEDEGPLPGTDDEDAPGPATIRAGTILYGQIDLGILNTEPGPVRATLLTGPYPGAYLLGSFVEAHRSLLLRFDTLIAEDGQEFSINAVAVDPDTRRAGIIDRYSSRFWERVGLAFVARTVQGFGEASAQVASTVTTTPIGSVVSQNEAPDTEDALFAGLGRGVEVIAEEAEARAATLPEIKEVFAGREVGVIFLSTVTE